MSSSTEIFDDVSAPIRLAGIPVAWSVQHRDQVASGDLSLRLGYFCRDLFGTLLSFTGLSCVQSICMHHLCFTRSCANSIEVGLAEESVEEGGLAHVGPSKESNFRSEDLNIAVEGTVSSPF